MKRLDKRGRRPRRRLPMFCLYASLASAALPAGLAAAQSDPAPAPGVSTPSLLEREAESRLEAQRQLTTSLAAIAADPTNFFALSQAGRASLAMGDARTAVGFLARAEALQPRDPIVKAALGAALVRMEDPVQAMRYFDAAIATGGLDRTYMSDRGLAFDLMGDQVRAQADYAVAAQSHPSAELVRRHAVSLGISGEVDRAVQMLGPLLRAQDRAAWRSRAMILAMNGRANEARQIAQATMPRQLADGLEPYFALMDRLTPAQLASASHFGRFPGYDVVRSQPVRAIGRIEVAVATPAPAPVDTRAANRNSRSRDRTAARPGRQPDGRIVVAAATPAPSPAPARTTASADVADIAAAPPPPPPRPTVVSSPVVQPIPESTPAAASPPATLPAPSPPLSPAGSPSPVPVSSVPPAIAASAATASPPPVRIAAADIPASRPAEVAAATPATGDLAGPVPTPSSTPAPAPVSPPGATRPFGPVDPSPRFAATLPVAPAVSNPAPVVTTPPNPPPSVASAAAPVPVSGPTADVVLAGWSLDSVVASIEIPETERAASRNALSAEEVQAIADAQRQRQASEAATARVDAEARRRSEAETRRRAEAEAAARAEAERVRRNPARVWVQVATGADLGALGYDCRRLARQHAASFQGQNCSAAVWNRTRRLLVGPFRNAAGARAWLATYSAAGGDGFVWNSDAGEEVVPVGRR